MMICRKRTLTRGYRFVTYGRKPYESDEGLDSGYGTSASSVALLNQDSPDEDSMDDMQ